jgi:protein tyrosine phosphatase
MKAFWWFEEGAIAGMARPGFNRARWKDLSFDEAVLLGWIGKYSSGKASLEKFRHHLVTYVPQIYKFHHHGIESGAKALEIFEQQEGILTVLDRLGQKTNFVSKATIDDDHLHFELFEDQLHEEIQFLKERGIGKIVCLTEAHNNSDILGDHFELLHLSIEDLTPPTIDQAQTLAEALKSAKKNKTGVAVHCLAGIGRTSTMLISAHILMGATLDEMLEKIQRQNPAFAMTGSQGDFVRRVAESVR